RPTPRASGNRNFWMPSERNTPPTIRRTRMTAAGASVARILRKNVMVWPPGGRSCLPQPLHLGPQRGLRRHADVPGRNLPVLVDQEGLYRGYVVVGGEYLVGVHVHLADLELPGQGLDGRVHRPARRAPRSPKIDQHRLAGLEDFLLPVELVQQHRP